MKVIFDRAHTHAGADYAPMQSEHVDAPTADWLVAHGVAHIAKSTRAAERSRDNTATATGDDDHE